MKKHWLVRCSTETWWTDFETNTKLYTGKQPTSYFGFEMRKWNAADMFCWNVLSEWFGIKRCIFLDNLLKFRFLKIFLNSYFIGFSFFFFLIFFFNCHFAWEILPCHSHFAHAKLIGTFQPAFRRAGEGAPGAARQWAESRTLRRGVESKQSEMRLQVRFCPDSCSVRLLLSDDGEIWLLHDLVPWVNGHSLVKASLQSVITANTAQMGFAYVQW